MNVFGYLLGSLLGSFVVSRMNARSYRKAAQADQAEQARQEAVMPVVAPALVDLTGPSVYRNRKTVPAAWSATGKLSR